MPPSTSNLYTPYIEFTQVVECVIAKHGSIARPSSRSQEYVSNLMRYKYCGKYSGIILATPFFCINHSDFLLF